MIKALISILNDKSIAETAIEYLGYLGEHAKIAIPALIEISESPDKLNNFALQACKKIKGEEPLFILKTSYLYTADLNNGVFPKGYKGTFEERFGEYPKEVKLITKDLEWSFEFKNRNILIKYEKNDLSFYDYKQE